MRALYTCNELGLGHVSRSILLGNRLIRNGHEVSFMSGGRAYQLFKDNFTDVHYCTPISWYETLAGIMPVISVLNIVFVLPLYDPEKRKIRMKRSSTMETIRRYYDERDVFMKSNADVVISDGDITSLRLAQLRDTTSIFITNVIRPNYDFPLNILLFLGQRLVEQYIQNADRIIIPDLPPPYTISEYNLRGLTQLGIQKKVKYVGPFTMINKEVHNEKGTDELIFASITGPLGSREKLKREIIPVLSRLKRESIVSLGEPYSSYSEKQGQCKIVGWLSEKTRNETMQRAKIIIMSGSHGTCFEALQFRKPSICFPTQIEQKANAMKLTDLHCSFVVRNQNELEQAINTIDENYDFYSRNVEKLGVHASQFHGLDTAIQVIEDVT